MAVADLTTINLAELKNKKKTYKETVTLNDERTEHTIEFQNDIHNQITYSESGANIVVTAYDTQEVTYRKVSTTISAEKETTGSHRGKYKVTTVTFNATYDGNGDVNGYGDGTTKITYSSKAGTGVETIEYQTINSKNKVIATTDTDVVTTHENRVIVNFSKVLATVTYKNAEKYADELDITSENNNNYDLLKQIFPATNSKNKYTGNWLQEEEMSTKANETFNLGVNRYDMDPDIIHYDMESEGGHGKDTVVLTKDSRLDIQFENDADIVRTFSKNKNNVILKMGKTADYSGSAYTKYVVLIEKSGSGYYITFDTYEWDEDLNEGEGGWKKTTDSVPVYNTAKQFKEIYDSFKKYEGITLIVGTNTYYEDTTGKIYPEAEETLAQVTFKNYLKLAQDGVTVGETSLKTLLEGAEGVGILGKADATKKQNLTGTFLREQFYGGTNNDTITTGDEYDIIYLSKGKDTVTVNGSGLKTIDYVRPDGFALGDTTVKFAKGVEFGFDEEGEVADGKTALSLVGLMDNEIFPFGFVKSGNDLVLDSDVQAKLTKRFFGGQPEMKNETLTIKDFFTENGAINGTIFGYDGEHKPETFDSEERQVFQLGSENKANNMSDTKYIDGLAGGNKADKFTISHGNASITGGKGNDTINVKEGATGKVSIAETMGSGNDTLNIDSEVGENAEFMIDGAYSKMMTSDKADISFEKTGNDLIFNMTYFKDVEAGIKKDINDSLTVKNFFNNEFDVAFGYSNLEPDDWYDVNKALDKKLIVNGVKDTDKESVTYKKTVFEGTDYADSMTYAGKGASYMAGGQGDDEYNVTLTKSSDLIISDTSGDNDVFLTNSVNNFRMLLNIDNEGNLVVDEDGSSLYVFNKSDFTAKNVVKGDKASGKIEIDSFFTLKDEAVYFGENYSMSAKEGALYMKNYIGQITSAVAGWFTTHEGYADVEAVLAENNANDVKSLIAVFDVNCPIDER